MSPNVQCSPAFENGHDAETNPESDTADLEDAVLGLKGLGVNLGFLQVRLDEARRGYRVCQSRLQLRRSALRGLRRYL